MKRHKPEAWTKIAKERMLILLDLAEREAAAHPERTKRYVGLARKIGMRYTIRSAETRKAMDRFCGRCSSLLRPGVTCRVRLRRDKQAVVVTCLACGSVIRHPYIREKKIIKQGRKT